MGSLKNIVCMLIKNINLWGGLHLSIIYYLSNFILITMSLIIICLSKYFLIIIYLIIKYLSNFFLITITIKECIHIILCMLSANSNLCGGWRLYIVHYISTFVLIIIYLIINYLFTLFQTKITFRECIYSILSMIIDNSNLCRGCHQSIIRYFCFPLFLANKWLN